MIEKFENKRNPSDGFVAKDIAATWIVSSSAAKGIIASENS
jgi:hypothetical protein